MILQVLLNILVLLFKLALWLLIAFAVIPFGIFVLLLNIFPDLITYDIWFWVAFATLNVVAYYFLWKPVIWTITTITELCVGNKVAEHSEIRERS